MNIELPSIKFYFAIIKVWNKNIGFDTLSIEADVFNVKSGVSGAEICLQGRLSVIFPCWA